ncbi:TonB-dependent receptor [Bordetella genomosp. 10]|nr:TonB-dependent siderophore receptor [Bordetella genomosp. 10]
MSRHPAHGRFRSAHPPRFIRRSPPLATHLLVAGGVAIGAGWAGHAYAQHAASAPATQPGAAAARSYDIPAGPLNAVLMRFLAESGVLLSGSTELAQGKNSSGVQGIFTPEAALAALLAGTGLQAVPDARGRYLLRPAPGGAEAPTVSTLEAVTVTAQAARADGLPEAYAGGQVARGGRVGLLGNMDFMDTPFNQTSYTAELMENQQAQMIADVLVGDPSVRDSGRKYGQASNAFFIRGLPFSTADASFNGLRGIFPMYRQPVEALERIEVLKGPNALLNSMGGSIAGDINLVPKRAADEPLTRLTTGYMSDSQINTHLDVGRRFGEDNAWGIRVNAVYRNGDTPIDQQGGHLGMGAVALDYRGERLRLSLDLLHQKARLRNISPFSFSFATADIPDAPRSSNAVLLGGEAEHEESSAAFRAEYDFSDAVSAYVAAGHLRQRSDVVTTQIANVMPNGDYRGTLASDAYGMDNTNIQVGTQIRFATGPVQHKLALTADRFHQRNLQRSGGRSISGPTVSGNIYEPTTGRLPAQLRTGTWGDLSTVDRQSVAVADTLSFMEDRLNVIAGVRKQYVEQEVLTTGVDYKDDALTPMVGLVVKPLSDLSLYANYIEGLLQGSVVNDPTSPDNGTVFPPYKTRQYEVGVKKDFGDFATTISLFEIKQPSQIVDPATREYSRDGKQRNRGIEWNVFGQLTPRLSMMGGVSYIDAKLTNTAGGTNNGNRAPGVPKLQANLGLDWAVPGVPGLTVGGRVIRTGNAYLDAANTQQVSGWTRFDLGARYTTRIAGKAVTFRGNVENVFNKDYWIAVNGGAVMSSPRTFMLSASVDF